MKYVYLFSEGNKDLKELLGGKGANLAEMTNLGFPVPQGFTITTEACLNYYQNKKELSSDIKKEIIDNLSKLETITGKKMGDSLNPLLVSVRSGARVSMPGMLDTILNLGMNDEIVEVLAIKTKNKRFAYDSYRRFIQMFADVVKGFSPDYFSGYFDNYKKEHNYHNDMEMTIDDLKEIIKAYKDNYHKLAHCDFPQDPQKQLIEAVGAVFESWNNDRAITYRRYNEIPSNWGTAVNVQEMVYGNLNDNSGTGVAFSRNPADGSKELYGEFLINAQGEDVVAGIRTPQQIIKLKDLMPNVYEKFKTIAQKLEDYYHDMQDMEFTIENGKLYILQTRNGKRSATAAIKIALDLYHEDKISRDDAILMVDPNQINSLLHPNFKESELKNIKPIFSGLAASPGAATGKICLTAEMALRAHEAGEQELILVRNETSPEDIEGMGVVKGVLTVHGGQTSHAAVVARGMGTTCICGCENLIINEEEQIIKYDNLVLKEGEYISLDGNTGNVYFRRIETDEIKLSDDFQFFMEMVNQEQTMRVLCNADTKKDAILGRKMGAEGIGLCRSEHMFFQHDKIKAIRQMILSETKEEREIALEKLLPIQQKDFEDLIEVMAPYPVTIRYLDPPLHEFLPKEEQEIALLAVEMGIDNNTIKERIASLKEINPMMGHRGCRLDITSPEILVMQTKAIINAAVNSFKKGLKPQMELMLPLINDVNEFNYLKEIVVREADKILNKENINIKYQVGTMMETPRACLTANLIAPQADFFSFGTNDLTQLTYGLSRDDSSKFLNAYYTNNIYSIDPFAQLDQNGVGKLISGTVNVSRPLNRTIKIGICGEHAGEAKSVEFCYRSGLDYVSCSPYRVPIAKLAAAQAAIKSKNIK